MAFRVGDTIGDYRIEAVLGEGGMGQVFRVRNLLSDRVEAMKIVIPGLEGRENLPERFLREIRVLASLDHPHIVTMRTALRVEDRIALVMEYVDGVSLYARLRAEGIATANVLRYMGQVLGALSYAHAHGIVHRDIKPDNILVTASGMAKLTDFGIASFKGDRALTSTGAAVGSLHYMSPEQVRGTDVDGRSDIYSVGITLYELTTGRRAIRGDSNWALMDGHLNQRPKPPMEVNPKLPQSLSDAILRSIEKKPADRFQTADEFRMALGEETVIGARLSNVLTQAMPATPTPPGVDAAQLAKLEKHMVTAVGPIGKQLVARAARAHTPMPELCQELATHISTPKEREEFLRTFAHEITPHSPTPGQARTMAAPTTPVPALDAEGIRAAKQKLAGVLGPIAGILVDKAARTARSRRELYEALAAQIPSESERQAFLKGLPK